MPHILVTAVSGNVTQRKNTTLSGVVKFSGFIEGKKVGVFVRGADSKTMVMKTGENKQEIVVKQVLPGENCTLTVTVVDEKGKIIQGAIVMVATNNGTQKVPTNQIGIAEFKGMKSNRKAIIAVRATADHDAGKSNLTLKSGSN